ncbi:DNA cytosine methyltransferase [Bacteroides heparinolyticus]|uniref:DNA cytosine methyltransferase n=1 Tax=Prevotella heparinolytica TaxID=28113 RepID=UPI0023F4AAAD|nr:DNA (cytosine-5-)-methyltransferase [Bacteroides heparinolyticus]
MNNQHKYPYRWTLADANFTKDKGKVFSCFACGGGSTMGYKLAGFDVIGCNEIDSRMMDVYCRNHGPKFPFIEPIQEFKKREDLPDELYNLDILDGSPPCSTFSMAGSREEAWGKMKHFREGQAEQVLDTLFFDFIDLAEKLQSKVVVTENVKGLLIGEAKDYVRRIYEAFDKAGYYCQHWLLDAQYMGVPQRRERVFFVCLRKDIAEPFLEHVSLFEETPKLNLDFNETPIMFGDVADYSGDEITGEKTRFLWGKRKNGDISQRCTNIRLYGKHSNFGQSYVYIDKICPTLTAKKDSLLLFDQPRFLGQSEVCCISSFPQDYDFGGQSPHYVCGMSVPPIMMAQIASRIYKQWLSRL